MVKKVFLVLFLIVFGAGLVFAEFEFDFGIYGGLGNPASAGLSMRLGYITPAYKGAAGNELNDFRWALLGDFGFGFRYGLYKKTYRYQEVTSWGGPQTKEMPYTFYLDYNMGLLTEFYFLGPLGIALGGGVAPGALEEWFVPYIRIELPLLFENGKVSIGFDYLFWGNKAIPPEVKMPPGYRFNLLLHLRGDLAKDLFTWWFWGF